MTPEDRLAALNLTLPTPPAPLANYVPTLRTGNLLYVSGQLPLRDGTLAYKGKLGADITLEDGRQAAALCLLNLLGHVHAATGALSAVTRILRLGGFIACLPTFTDLPQVMNGASDLAVALFGDAGRHTRSTVGVPVLPADAPVEIEGLFELR